MQNGALIQKHKSCDVAVAYLMKLMADKKYWIKVGVKDGPSDSMKLLGVSVNAFKPNTRLLNRPDEAAVVLKNNALLRSDGTFSET